MKKVIKIVVVLLIIFLLIFLLDIVRKVAILQSCKDGTDSNNYYAKSIVYYGSGISSLEKYYKDGRQMIKVTNTSDSEMVFYNDFTNNDSKLLVNGKSITDDSVEEPNITPKVSIIVGLDFWDNLANSFVVDISTEKCNGKDCYLIENKLNGQKIWVEKERKLPVREIAGIANHDGTVTNLVTDYIFSFDTVTDEDL